MNRAGMKQGQTVLYGIAQALTLVFAMQASVVQSAEELSERNIVQTRTCLDRSPQANPQMPGQKVLSSIYNDLRAVPVGRNLAEESVALCLDPSFGQMKGLRVFGDYGDNMVRLNARRTIPAVESRLTAIHEYRHHVHEKLNIFFHSNGNIPVHERVIVLWMMEADARLASVMYAYEMQQIGQPQYVAHLKKRKDSDYRAFAAHLSQKPGDVRGAMQAAFLSFIQTEYLTSAYASDVREWVENNKLECDPQKPVLTLLDDAHLMKMGEMAPYGNYMTLDMIEAMKRGFTGEGDGCRHKTASPSLSLSRLIN